MFGWLDPMYVAFLAPAMILAIVATIMTRTAFGRYARVPASSGMTGGEAARRILDENGLGSVRVERTHGFLGDHYDPSSRTLRLSPQVCDSASLSAIGVACHEAGHALQHASRFAPLALRSALVPAAQLGSHGAYLFFMLGMLANMPGLMKAGIVLFSLVVLFSIITLPVEWDASRRARKLMVSSGIVTAAERGRAGAVLNAAFLTYVAAAFTAIMTLLYYLARAGLLGGRRDN